MRATLAPNHPRGKFSAQTYLANSAVEREIPNRAEHVSAVLLRLRALEAGQNLPAESRAPLREAQTLLSTALRETVNHAPPS